VRERVIEPDGMTRKVIRKFPIGAEYYPRRARVDNDPLEDEVVI